MICIEYSQICLKKMRHGGTPSARTSVLLYVIMGVLVSSARMQRALLEDEPSQHTHTCSAVTLAVVDDALSCDADWSSVSAWLDGTTPQVGDAVEVIQPLVHSSTCVTATTEEAVASRIVLKNEGDSGTTALVRVQAGGLLRVRGDVIAGGDGMAGALDRAAGCSWGVP